MYPSIFKLETILQLIIIWFLLFSFFHRNVTISYISDFFSISQFRFILSEYVFQLAVSHTRYIVLSEHVYTLLISLFTTFTTLFLSFHPYYNS
jgi:hypothetical protein